MVLFLSTGSQALENPEGHQEHRRRTFQLGVGGSEAASGDVRRLAVFSKGREKVGYEKLLDDIRDAFELFSHQRDGVMKVVLHPHAADAGQLTKATTQAMATT